MTHELNIFATTETGDYTPMKFPLAKGDVIAGSATGEPVVENVNNMLTAYTGKVVVTGSGMVIPNTSHVIDIDEFITTHFPAGDEKNPDKGVSFEFDIQFYLDHKHKTNTDPPYIHYSLSGNILARFSALKTNTSAWAYQLSGLNEISKSFAWIQYDSDTTPYGRKKDNGSSIAGTFIELSTSGANISLLIKNPLNAVFSGRVDWELNFKYILKANQYDTLN